MATIGGARALGMDGRDRLTRGRQARRPDRGRASTAFTSSPHYDPYSLLAYSTKAADVETVIVEGRVVVEDGRVLTLDAAAVLERAGEYRAKLRQPL